MTIRAELIFALAAVTLVVSSAKLEQAAAQASSEIPRAAGGKPDFNGIYEWPSALPGAASAAARRRSSIARTSRRSSRAASRSSSRGPATRATTSRATSACRRGFPSAFLGPYPMQILPDAKYLVMVHEFQRMTRIIPLDGRPHRHGHRADVLRRLRSGKWEGDTLVIDTTNFKRWSLDDYYYTNSEGVPDAQRRAHDHRAHPLEEPDALRTC